MLGDVKSFYFPGGAPGGSSLVMVGVGMGCPDVQMSRPKGFLCFGAAETDCFLKIQIFLCLFFFFFFLSVASFPLSFQVRLSPRGLFLPGCVPQFLHSLWQPWDVIYLRRSPHIQEADLFPGTFWDGPLLGLFTPCLFLLPLAQPLPHFRGFWGPLCRFFGVCRL